MRRNDAGRGDLPAHYELLQLQVAGPRGEAAEAAGGGEGGYGGAEGDGEQR